MKLVAWLGGPEVAVKDDWWTALDIREDEAVSLLTMNLWINLNGGLFIPVEVEE